MLDNFILNRNKIIHNTENKFMITINFIPYFICIFFFYISTKSFQSKEKNI